MRTAVARVRKRIEQVFGWGKTVGQLLKIKVRGLANIAAQSLMTLAAYNLIRLRKFALPAPDDGSGIGEVRPIAWEMPNKGVL